MTCMEAEKMVVPYMKDELSPTELEDFLDHIKTCENCREELEIYYILQMGLRQMDEDNDHYDLAAALERKLQISEHRVRRRHAFLVFKYAAGFLECGFCAVYVCADGTVSAYVFHAVVKLHSMEEIKSIIK